MLNEDHTMGDNNNDDVDKTGKHGRMPASSNFYAVYHSGSWITLKVTTYEHIICLTTWTVKKSIFHIKSPLMTSSSGNIFRVTGLLCGEFIGPDEFPSQRPVMRSFDVFFDLCLNKQVSKQSWGWWSETPSSSLWRQCNVGFTLSIRPSLSVNKIMSTL